MATTIANVMWIAFVRWLQPENSKLLPAVVEECFEVLASFARSTGPSASYR